VNATELAKMLQGWPEGANPNPPFLFKGTPLDHDGPWWIDNSVGMERGIDLATVSGLRWLMKQKSGSLRVDPTRKYHVSCEPETLFRVVLSDRGGPCVSLAFPHDDYYVNELETDHTGPTLLHAINSAILATKTT